MDRRLLQQAEPQRAELRQRSPRSAVLAAGLALGVVLGGSLLPGPAAAQGWWVPWGNEQRPPTPREPVRPQPPPQPAPPPAYIPPPAASSGGSYGGRSPICVQLEQRLVAEGRGNQARDVLPRIENDIRTAERQMRSAQAELERGGCYEYEFLMFGKTLKRDPRCRSLAGQAEQAKRRVAELDAQRQQIQQSGGRSLRDDIVAELARNNCGSQYQQEASRNRGGIFPSLWQDEEGGGAGTRFNYGATFRTVCVRLCDGAFFPVSFSTLPVHFDRDQDLCQQKCAAPAELYYYSQSPGAGIEQAISHKTRQPYSSLRTAFRFRKEFVSGCSCKQAEFLPQGTPPPTPASAPATSDRRADAIPAAGGAVAPVTGPRPPR